MKVRVKICGLTTVDDALGCVEAGADVLGLNLWPGSKRHVSLDAARAIAAALPSGTVKVGVFVRAGPDEVRRAVAALALDAVQLHGDEDVAAYTDVGAPVWQVLRVADVPPGPPHPRAASVLLDAKVDGFGGAGARFDWTLARAARGWGVPVWIAGGLTPEVVADAVRIARPAGVDVASGVESAPGRKDLSRVRALVAAVRAVETER